MEEGQVIVWKSQHTLIPKEERGLLNIGREQWPVTMEYKVLNGVYNERKIRKGIWRSED